MKMSGAPMNHAERPLLLMKLAVTVAIITMVTAPGPKGPNGSRWRRIAPYGESRPSRALFPGGEASRVLVLIEYGVTALLCLGDDRSERRHAAPQVDETVRAWYQAQSSDASRDRRPPHTARNEGLEIDFQSYSPGRTDK